MFLYAIVGICVNIYILIIIIQVAMSWLIAFDIVNADNDAAIRLTEFTKKATDPVYTPIKKYVPPIGGMDFTPLVVIIGLQILLSILNSIIF